MRENNGLSSPKAINPNEDVVESVFLRTEEEFQFFIQFWPSAVD